MRASAVAVLQKAQGQGGQGARRTFSDRCCCCCTTANQSPAAPGQGPNQTAAALQTPGIPVQTRKWPPRNPSSLAHHESLSWPLCRSSHEKMQPLHLAGVGRRRKWHRLAPYKKLAVIRPVESRLAAMQHSESFLALCVYKVNFVYVATDYRASYGKYHPCVKGGNLCNWHLLKQGQMSCQTPL